MFINLYTSLFLVLVVRPLLVSVLLLMLGSVRMLGVLALGFGMV